MNQKKLSKNINVVKTFNDFAQDTQLVDFDYEDLVDYVTENADVFYWLNIESIWGRCGFIWDTYENYGHFNKTSLVFGALPKIPDPERIKSLYGLFTQLNGGTYTINDNNWEHIDTLGGWGNQNQTIIMNMPSANFTKLDIKQYDSTYYPFVNLDNVDWSTLKNTFKLKITDDNKNIVKLDVSKLIETGSLSKIQLNFDSAKKQEESINLYNIPEVIPYSSRSRSFQCSTSPTEYTLYRQYVDEEETQQASRTIFPLAYYNDSKTFFWPFQDEENPPIYMEGNITSMNEANFVNCTVLPAYKNNYTHEDKIEIPEEYDIFNNPNHKIRYYSSNYVIKPGVAYYNNILKFTSKLDLRINIDLVKQMNTAPSFTYSGVTINLDQSNIEIPESSEESLQKLSEGEEAAIVAIQNKYDYSSSNGLTKQLIAYGDPGITLYSTSDDKVSCASYCTWTSLVPTIDGKYVECINVINSDKDLSYAYSTDYGLSRNIIMLQDIYYNSGYLYIPKDTKHKIILNDKSKTSNSFILIDCDTSNIPNIFDFTDVSIKEGNEIQDKVTFSSFYNLYFKHEKDSPEFITVDDTLDLIWKDTIYIVSNPTKSCLELMQLFKSNNIFEYPLNKVKQIGTTDGKGYQIHIEGGYVLSLKEGATEGDAEGVEYFLSKFKFNPDSKPKENSLYLNSEQRSLFTEDQIKLLNDNGWEVVEVIIT